MAKLEAKFCTVIKHAMVDAYKIPDDTSYMMGGHGGQTTKRPLDGIGMIDTCDGLKFCAWEAKYMPSAQALNISKRLEEHQDYYLRSWARSGILTYLIVGVDYGRADKRVFIFDWDEKFGALYKTGKFSIHKKVLDTLPFNKVYKDTFLFENILTYDEVIKHLGIETSETEDA